MSRITADDIAGAVSDGLTRKVTYSQNAPAGGVDGDWWLPGPVTSPGMYRRVSGSWVRIGVLGEKIKWSDVTWELGKTYPLDAPTDQPVRACANCARQFQPTTVRRMLCRRCYREGTPPSREDDRARPLVAKTKEPPSSRSRTCKMRAWRTS